MFQVPFRTGEVFRLVVIGNNATYIVYNYVEAQKTCLRLSFAIWRVVTSSFANTIRLKTPRTISWVTTNVTWVLCARDCARSRTICFQSRFSFTITRIRACKWSNTIRMDAPRSPCWITTNKTWIRNIARDWAWTPSFLIWFSDTAGWVITSLFSAICILTYRCSCWIATNVTRIFFYACNNTWSSISNCFAYASIIITNLLRPICILTKRSCTWITTSVTRIFYGFEMRLLFLIENLWRKCLKLFLRLRSWYYKNQIHLLPRLICQYSQLDCYRLVRCHQCFDTRGSRTDHHPGNMDQERRIEYYTIHLH